MLLSMPSVSFVTFLEPVSFKCLSLNDNERKTLFIMWPFSVHGPASGHVLHGFLARRFSGYIKTFLVILDFSGYIRQVQYIPGKDIPNGYIKLKTRVYMYYHS